MCPRTPGIILRNIGKTIRLTSASANIAAVEIVVLKTTQIKPLTEIENSNIIFLLHASPENPMEILI